MSTSPTSLAHANNALFNKRSNAVKKGKRKAKAELDRMIAESAAKDRF